FWAHFLLQSDVFKHTAWGKSLRELCPHGCNGVPSQAYFCAIHQLHQATTILRHPVRILRSLFGGHHISPKASLVVATLFCSANQTGQYLRLLGQLRSAVGTLPNKDSDTGHGIHNHAWTRRGHHCPIYQRA
ncbi:hypothetical protein HPB47_026078, partial [Ixodes persulcatus]